MLRIVQCSLRRAGRMLPEDVPRSSPFSRPSPLTPKSFLTRSLFTMPEYAPIDGSERLEKYTPGGYHPILVGDTIRDRYQVVDKLGHGGWSTVWLVHDADEQKYLALKVGIVDSLPREIPILRALGNQAHGPGAERTPRLLDVFTISGPNGSHPCYTTTLALGDLRECSFSRLFRHDVARILAYELTLAVAYVHAQGFVHGGLRHPHLHGQLGLY